MSSDVPASPETVADDLPLTTKTLRRYANRLFAEIAVRVVAFGLDIVLVLFALVIARDHLGIGLDGTAGQVAWALVLLAYFAACWASPLRATPIQFLFGMRVLHESGTPLSLRDAVIRGAVLLAQWWLVTELVNLALLPNSLTGVVAAALLLLVPVVTRHRQAIHDFAARSIVVNRRAQQTDKAHERMLAFLADNNAGSQRARRPSILKISIDAVALAVPIVVMTIGVQTATQKNMYARVAYAISQTEAMQRAVELHYLAEGRWPDSESELGMPLRHAYPDGGFFKLDDDGVIRIQFEVRPELKHGSILLAPHADQADIDWHCRIDGAIDERFVLNLCRTR